MNVMYTATEDHISVITVGSCLRQTLNWSVMFVFTLVQSRTHVDTVQNVLRGIINSSHICWSHTMKVLGFCTAAEMKSHLLVHSDYKQFCCFLCNKCFKREVSVKQHFVRCAANMTFDDDWWTLVFVSVCSTCTTDILVIKFILVLVSVSFFSILFSKANSAFHPSGVGKWR